MCNARYNNRCLIIADLTYKESADISIIKQPQQLLYF